MLERDAHRVRAPQCSALGTRTFTQEDYTMPREASLFEESGESPLEAYLLLRQDGGNIPPAWIERARASHKKREKTLAAALQENSLDALALLRDWELAYSKECFYQGIRALMELERAGKTKL